MTDTTLDPLSQAQVEAEIRRISGLLEQHTIEHAEACEVAAEEDAKYDLAYAKALLAQPRVFEGEKVTVAEREARALLAVEDLVLASKTTDAIYRASQERGRNLRAQLDALRTIAANVRDVVAHGY